MKSQFYEITPSTNKDWEFLFNFQGAPEKIYIESFQTDPLEVLKKTQSHGIAIVGTRHPSQRILNFISDQLSLLKNSSFITVSGFAQGIDQQCHAISIKNNIPTIAILGCGLSKEYPKNSKKLRQSILENNGIIISEFPNETPPFASNFIKRNRLIAAWSRCIWIAEAKIPSGALNTAYWARQYDKDCYCTPCFPNDPYTFGNQKLLDDFHAQPFWGIHSLGSTWLELSTLRLNMKKKINSFENTQLSTLLTLSKNLARENGFINLQTLIDKLISEKWTFNEAYEVIQSAKDQNYLKIKNGLIEFIQH